MSDATEMQRPDTVEIAESLDASDVLVLDVDRAAEVLTENRVELLDAIRSEDPGSIRGLARAVDRNVNGVMRDLKVLYESDIIAFEADGNRKMPRLRHDAVVVEPVVR